MKSLGFISQIATIAVAVVIAFFYVQPTVQNIGQIQSDIGEYQSERQKIEQINTKLNNHVATIAAISPADKQLLATYMPALVDDIAVMRDIEFIVKSVGLAYTQLTYDSTQGGGGARFDSSSEEIVSALGELAATPYSFSVSVEGSYDQIKSLLLAFEQNHYPLEVHTLDILSGESESILSASITLVTYAAELSALDTNN